MIVIEPFFNLRPPSIVPFSIKNACMSGQRGGQSAPSSIGYYVVPVLQIRCGRYGVDCGAVLEVEDRKTADDCIQIGRKNSYVPWKRKREI